MKKTWNTLCLHCWVTCGWWYHSIYEFDLVQIFSKSVWLLSPIKTDTMTTIVKVLAACSMLQCLFCLYINQNDNEVLMNVNMFFVCSPYNGIKQYTVCRVCHADSTKNEKFLGHKVFPNLI